MGSKTAGLIATPSVLLAVVLVVLGLRFWARARSAVSLGWDDGLIVAATCVTFGMSIAQIYGSVDGLLGHHIVYGPGGAIENVDRFVIYEKVLWAATWMTALGSGLTKLSLLCYYRRIFAAGRFRIISLVYIGIISSWAISFTFAIMFQCTPVSWAWSDSLELAQPHCVSLPKLLVAYATSDLVTDIMILSLPVPMIWRLQMPTVRKVGVSMIFMLGAFVIVASIVRLVVYIQIARDAPIRGYDITWHATTAAIWNTAEATMAIVCACLPTLAPLFRAKPVKRFFARIRNALGLRRHGSSGQPSPGGSGGGSSSGGASGGREKKPALNVAGWRVAQQQQQQEQRHAAALGRDDAWSPAPDGKESRGASESEGLEAEDGFSDIEMDEEAGGGGGRYMRSVPGSRF